MIGTNQAPYQPNNSALFVPLPWHLEPWRYTGRAMLLTGSAGGGKSRLAGEKVHAFLLKYPNATGLVLRKTRESMTNSTLLFMERTVIGRDPRVRHLKADHRFEYSNGSVMAYGGMKDEDQREQIRSIGLDGGLDIALLEEAIRFTETDYNELIARMRGKAGGWTQIILCTNPGGPAHWINQRLILGGEAKVYTSSALDNPHNPPEYIENLNYLTGILRARLRDGKWVQAEGVVYSEFDEGNITDKEPNPELPVEIAVDDGYIDPRAILFIQRTGTEILVWDEFYHSKHLEEVCVDEVIEKCGEKFGWRDEEKTKPNVLPEIAVGSPEAVALRQHFRKRDIVYRSDSHKIVEGIKVVRRLICDGNEYRTLKVHRRCKNLINEITEGYQYPELGSKKDDENPIDKNNHAVDALRYWCWVRARK